MKKACKTYDQKTISQFVDNELPSEEHKLIAEHIEICPICKNIAERYLYLSDAFAQNTSRQVDKFDTSMIRQNVIEKIKREENSLFKKVFDYFSPKFYIKVASVVTIMVVSLIYFQTQAIKPTNVTEPSAIVTLVDGNVSSVMILETEKSKHTIIWFSEA